MTVNLFEIFNNCPKYAIILLSSNPSKFKGTQLNVVCKDINKVERHLTKYKNTGIRFYLYSKYFTKKFTKDILDQVMYIKYGKKKFM